MLGPDVTVPQAFGIFLRQAEHAARALGKAFEFI